jgi:hypothetical protein
MLIVSPDSHLMIDGKYVWTPERVRRAWVLAMKELEEALSSGKFQGVTLMMGAPGAGKSTWLRENGKENRIYFDAVFKNAASRKPLLEMAAKFGVPLNIVFLDTPLQVCLDRNAQRSPDRKVPEETLLDMWGCCQNSVRVIPANILQVVRG